MAIIPRKFQKIFAGSATNNGQFGSAQAGTKVTSSDLATLQSLTAFTNGWTSAVVGSRQLPPLEEFQALDYITTTQLAYIFQEGIPEYDASTEYRINSFVKKSGTSEVYVSQTNGNTGNALTNPTYWVLGIDFSGTGLLKAANNLSDLGTLATALTNLGFASNGTSYFKIPNPSDTTKPWVVQFFAVSYAGASVVSTFPIAFPNNLRGVYGTAFTTTGAQDVIEINANTLTTVTTALIGGAGAAQTGTGYLLAIGN